MKLTEIQMQMMKVTKRELKPESSKTAIYPAKKMLKLTIVLTIYHLEAGVDIA